MSKYIVSLNYEIEIEANSSSEAKEKLADVLDGSTIMDNIEVKES